MTSATACPWCQTGTLSLTEAETIETWHSGFHSVENGAGLADRRRACTVAACNACEFVVEVNHHGIVDPDGLLALEQTFVAAAFRERRNQ